MAASEHRPVLIVIAGPNRSSKIFVTSKNEIKELPLNAVAL